MSREKQIEELTAELIKTNSYGTLNAVAEHLYNAGYRKQNENVIELPCKAGDLVHFKGLETPWKVSAIHIYEEGQLQISITSETGKITSTMTANEFYMFCSVLTEEEAKMTGGD